MVYRSDKKSSLVLRLGLEVRVKSKRVVKPENLDVYRKIKRDPAFHLSPGRTEENQCRVQLMRSDPLHSRLTGTAKSYSQWPPKDQHRQPDDARNMKTQRLSCDGCQMKLKTIDSPVCASNGSYTVIDAVLKSHQGQHLQSLMKP